LREWVVAKAGRRLGEHVSALAPYKRRQRVGGGAGTLVWVASGQQLAVYVARLSRDPDVVLHARVVRLQFLVRERPVLDGGALGDPVRTVALHVVAAVAHVRRVEAPGLGGPVDPCPTYAVAGVERPELSDRQRGRPGVRPPAPGLLGEVHHHGLAYAVPQAVMVVLEVGSSEPRRPLLQRDNAVTRLRQVPGEDRCRPARADGNDVYFPLPRHPSSSSFLSKRRRARAPGRDQSSAPWACRVPETGRITCSFAGSPGWKWLRSAMLCGSSSSVCPRTYASV